MSRDVSTSNAGMAIPDMESHPVSPASSTITRRATMNTRKYPRTLNEAFGPYACGPIQEPHQPMEKSDTIVLVASIIAAVAFVAIGAIWG